MAGSDSGTAPGGVAPAPAAPDPNNPTPGFSVLPTSPDLRKSYEEFAKTGFANADQLLRVGHKANYVDYWNGAPQMKANPDQGFYNVDTGQSADSLVAAYNAWTTAMGKENAQVKAYRDMVVNSPGRNQTIITPPIQFSQRQDQPQSTVLGGGLRPDISTVKTSLLGGGR